MNFIYRSTHMKWSIPQDPTERLRELCATLNDIPIQHTKTKNRKRKTKTKTRNTILCSILCSFLHLHRWKMKGNNQFNHRERNYRDDDRYSDRWNYDNRGSRRDQYENRDQPPPRERVNTPIPTPAPAAAVDLAAMFSQFLQSQQPLMTQVTTQSSHQTSQPEVTPSRPLPPPAAAYETPAAVSHETPVLSRPPSNPMNVKPRPQGSTTLYGGTVVVPTRVLRKGISIKAYDNEETVTPQGYVRKANRTLTVVIDNDTLHLVENLTLNWETYITAVVNNPPIVANPRLTFPQISENGAVTAIDDYIMSATAKAKHQGTTNQKSANVEPTSPQKKAAATPPKSAKVLAMTHSANKTAMAMKDDKCMRLAANILTSAYGLGSLQAPVTIFQALGELLETDIDVNLIMVSQAARLTAFDRLATAIATRLDNDIALPIYDAVRLKAASMVTPPPTTPTATQSQPQQSTTMVEILESSETTTSQMEEPAKRKRTTSKRKNQDEREETQPNERTKRVKTRNV